MKNKIEDIANKISEICANKNKQIVEEFLQQTSDGLEGFGHQKVWKI